MRRLFHQLLTFTLALSLILAPLTEAQAAVPDGRIDVASYGVTAALPTGAGYEYLEELAARPDTTVQPIVLLDYAYYDKTTQISPAAMALLSIAVGQFVGGLNFIQGIESVFWQSAAKAGLSSVITQSVAGVVSGEFDIGEILEGAAFAGLSAGLTAGIDANDLHIKLGDGAKLSLLGKGDNFTLAALVEGTIDAGIKAGLTSAVYGSDFGDAFLDSLSATVTSALLADVQTLIGDQGLAEGSSGHAFLHGLAGCAFAEASGGDCRAGFAAGVAQSLYAGTLDINNPDFDRGAALNTAELIGAFAGFVFSSGQGENVSLAGQVSQSGVENNYLTHAQWEAMIGAFKRCGNDNECLTALLLEYHELSLEQEHELAMCGNDLLCMAEHVRDLAQTAHSELINAFFADPALTQIDDDAIQSMLIAINGVQHTSLVTYGVLPDDENAGAWQYAYSAYPEWAANNCASASGADCMAAFQTNEVHGYGGLAHSYHTGNSAVAMYTIGAGGVGVLAARGALTALANCALNPACLGEITIAIGEVTGATAGQAVFTVGAAGLAGKVVLQHGDQVLGVLDDAGRFFAAESQEADDAGRFLVRAADGTVGYLDDASGFVPSGRFTGDISKLTPAERAVVERELAAGRNIEMIPTGTGLVPQISTSMA